MIRPDIPSMERDRLISLESYQILDTDSEEVFDDITKIASQICEKPISLVSFIDKNRIWFKSKHGLELSETYRDVSYCAHAINGPNKIFEIPDATKDERFFDNPLLIDNPNVRFYAGAPITNKEGYTLGTLCVIDNKPGKLTEDQKHSLWSLSRVVLALLEKRKNSIIQETKEESYKELVEDLNDAVFELNEHGTIVFSNSKTSQLLNLPEEAIKKLNIWDIVHPDDAFDMKTYFKNAYKNFERSCYYEYRVLRKDRSYVWVGQNSKMNYEGSRMVKLRAIARDLSAYYSLRHQLEIKESKYKLVSENSSDMIALHEIDGTYKFVSEASEAITGYKSAELVGKNPYLFIHPDDRDRLREEAHRDTLEGKSIFQIAYRFKRKDGTYIWLESYTKPILNDKGLVDSFQTSSRDITDRIKEKIQLQKAKHKAEEASRAKQSFLSMMSHEIRTPLNGVIGATHLLLGRDHDLHQRKYLKILEQSGQNLLSIVNDILDFSKIEEGKIHIENSRFNLNDLTRILKENYLIKANEKDIKINFYYSKEVKSFYYGDSVRIGQILHNLLSNAIKFTNEGYVKLAIRLKDRQELYDIVHFEIEDTGIGIPESKQQKIFETFSQAEEETTRKYGGSGLGLTISKKLANIMGTDINLISYPQKGSSFFFNLKLKRARKPKTKQSEEIQMFEPINAKVLLVEDNEFNRAIACDFLTNWHCDVVEAKNGKEALEILAIENFDLIVLDLQMPIMDGYETAIVLRQQKITTPIIALTAEALKETREKVLEVGMSDIVAKPFLPADFYNKIKRNFSNDNQAENTTKTSKRNFIDKFENQDEKIIKYLNIFKTILNEELDQLNEHIQNQELEPIKRTSHKLKSSLKIIGLYNLASLAESLECMISNDADIGQILNQSKTFYKKLKKIQQKI